MDHPVGTGFFVYLIYLTYIKILLRATRKEIFMIKRRKIGQPRKFETVEDLQEEMNNYLSYCDTFQSEVSSFDRDGNQILELVPNPKIPNVLGFCVFSGISRQTFYDYKLLDDYIDTIKAFTSLVEAEYQDALTDKTRKSVTGAIFILKSKHGWKEENTVDHTSSDGSMSPKKTTVEIVEQSKYKPVRDQNGNIVGGEQ